jgi:hypothetical protein
MKLLSLLTVFCLFLCLFLPAQKNAVPVSMWRGVIHRQDQNNVVFNFELQQKNKKIVLLIRNAGETLRVDGVQFTGYSVFIKMPVFESSFKAKIADDKWSGVWMKGTARRTGNAIYCRKKQASFSADKRTSRNECKWKMGC